MSSAGRLLEELAFAFVAYYEESSHGETTMRLVLLAERLRSGETRGRSGSCEEAVVLRDFHDARHAITEWLETYVVFFLFMLYADLPLSRIVGFGQY